MDKHRSVQFLVLLISLFFLGVAPPLVGALFKMGTYAPGIILSVGLFFVFLSKFWLRLLSAQVSALIWFALLALWSLIQVVVLGGLNDRAIYSLVPFFLLVVTAKLVALYWARVDDRIVYLLIVTAVKVGGVLAIVNFLSGFEIGYLLGYPYNKSIFPFGEPSHFALFFGAFWLAFCLIVDRVACFIWSGIYFSMAILLPSLSLLIYVVILIVMSLKFTPSRLLALAFVVSCISIWALSSRYLLSRINFFGDVNLSGLVYLQGLFDAYNGFVETSGFGLGFQMLGTQPASDVSLEIARILGTDEATNRFDGGFLAAKLLAEYGVLGLVLVLLYLRCAIQSLVWVRGVCGRGAGELKELLCHCVVLGFSVELFVRGIGYFSAGVFLFLIAIFYLGRGHAHKKTHNDARELLSD